MEMGFADTLRVLRTEHNMTQQQLADILHVDRSTITYWESGRRTPDLGMINRIAECLEVDVSVLLGKTYGEKPVIIIVEDEKPILSGNVQAVEEAVPSAAVSGFTRPSEAIAFAREHPVAVAFLDIEIGNTSGLDLCSELLSINPRTNVIFVTAYMDYSFRAWDTGASGFLMKPLRAEDVQRQLGRLRHPVWGI